MAVIAVQGVASALQPDAYFIVNASTGVAYPGSPFAVQFTDQSTNSPTSWSWNFGDGTTSPLQNPVHSFSGAGEYPVTLTVTNSDGSSQATQNINVELRIDGNVTEQDLSVADLQDPFSYTQITQDVVYYKHNDLTPYWLLGVEGASLNDVLTGAGAGSTTASITFIGGDGFTQTIPYTTITGDTNSVVAYANASPDNSLRNILPSQTYAQQWVKDLVEIRVNV